MTSKCNGGLVYPERGVGPWQQVVSYNPNPHEYSTLNLPSWEACDYPFLNITLANKECDLVKYASQHGSCHDVNSMHVVADGDKLKWHADWQLKHGDHYSRYNNESYVYYGNNVFHWDNNRQGATNLYWDKTYSDVAFQVG